MLADNVFFGNVWQMELKAGSPDVPLRADFPGKIDIAKIISYYHFTNKTPEQIFDLLHNILIDAKGVCQLGALGRGLVAIAALPEMNHDSAEEYTAANTN